MVTSECTREEHVMPDWRKVRKNPPKRKGGEQKNLKIRIRGSVFLSLVGKFCCKKITVL